jgi:hypothetical protein
MSLPRHWKIVLGLLIVFVAGLAIGSAATVGVIQRAYRQRMDPGTWTPRTMAWLDRDVQISSSQAAQVRPIVENSMQEINELRLEANQRRKQIFGELFGKISKYLTEPQRARLEAAIRQAIARQAANEATTP